MGERALCVLCRVGDDRLALRASDVYKVVSHTRVSRLPRLPAAIAGITHHRGRIVTVLDARPLFFGGPGRSHVDPDKTRLLVIDRSSRHLALLVDAVDAIEHVRFGPDLLPGPHPALRLTDHQGQAILAVDADRLVDAVLEADTPRVASGA